MARIVAMRTPDVRALPLRLSAAALVLFVANFLPWGSVRFESAFGSVFSGLPSDAGGMPMVNLTGWSGSTTVLWVLTPNWTPFAAALLLALWSWFDEGLGTKRWPQWLALALLLHALFFGFVILTQGGARLGLGLLVDLATWVAVLLNLRRSPIAKPSGAVA